MHPSPVPLLARRWLLGGRVLSRPPERISHSSYPIDTVAYHKSRTVLKRSSHSSLGFSGSAGSAPCAGFRCATDEASTCCPAFGPLLSDVRAPPDRLPAFADGVAVQRDGATARLSLHADAPPPDEPALTRAGEAEVPSAPPAATAGVLEVAVPEG